MAAANWGLPTPTSVYTDFITQLDARLDDAAKQFYSADGDPTTPPENSIRWNSTNTNWQRYTTAGGWAALATTYNITSTAAATLATGRAFSLTGDVTATAITFNGSAAVALSTVLSNSGVTAGSYGSNQAVPVLGIDAKGRVTAASTQALGNMALQTASSIAVTGGTLSGVAITLPFGTGSTTEGVIQWVTASDALAIGAGASTVTFSHNTGTATLSNKTLDNTSVITVKGTSFTLQDPTTTTKQARFVMSGITAATTRSWTFPDADGTFVGLTNTQTLTNKTLSTGTTASGITITAGTIANTAVDLTSGSFIAPLSVTPAQTANGSIVWDSDTFVLTVGDGTSRKTLVDLDSAQTITNKTATFTANLFTLKDATDPTRLVQFSCANTTTATTRIFSLPAIAADTTLAVIGNVAQTFTGNTTFSNVNGHFGSSAGAALPKVGCGATTSGTTKTVSLGTAGLSGSVTNIDIGSSVSGSTTNITLNGTQGVKVPEGTTAERPTGVNGLIRYNSDLNQYEGYAETAWAKFNQSESGYKNKIINGNFDVWQRGTSQTTSGILSADRWYQEVAGSSTFTASRGSHTIGQTDLPNATYYNSVAFTTGGLTSSYTVISNRIEDVNFLAGKTVTISFKAKATTASKKVALELVQKFGTGGSPDVSKPLGLFNLTTSWAKYSVTTTLDSISTKTIGTGGTWTSLLFWLDAGATYATRASSIGTQSATIYFGEIQLEVGSIATDFEQRSLGEELGLCYRYFYKYGGVNVSDVSFSGYREAGGSWFVTIHLPVPMRVTPSVSIVGTFNSSNVTSWTWHSYNTTEVVFSLTATATGYLGVWNGTPSTQYLTFNCDA